MMRITEKDFRALQARGLAKELPPRPQKSKPNHANYANRGMGLQKLVDQANEQYREQKVAFIWGPGTPAKWLPGGRIIQQAATVDHIGTYRGRGLAFDDKETQTGSLPASNVKEHQINFLLDFARIGNGIAFLLVCYAREGRFFVVPIEKYWPLWRNRRGLKVEDAEAIGAEVFASQSVCLDYLKGVEP